MTIAPSSVFTLACRQTSTLRSRLPAFALPAVAATPQAPLRPPRPPTRKARIAVYCGWLPRFGVEAQAQQRQLPLQTRTSVRACAAAAASACAAALAHVPFRFLLVRVIVVRNARDPRGNRVYLPLLPPPSGVSRKLLRPSAEERRLPPIAPRVGIPRRPFSAHEFAAFFDSEITRALLYIGVNLGAAPKSPTEMGTILGVLMNSGKERLDSARNAARRLFFLQMLPNLSPKGRARLAC